MRADSQNFLRALAGNVACKVIGAYKGKRVGKFWDLLAFSRIVEWGRSYISLIKYVEQNQKEADGTISYKPRGPPKKG